MGLLKDAFGPAFGAGQVNNGLNGPMSKLKNGFSGNTSSSSDPRDQTPQYLSADRQRSRRDTRSPGYRRGTDLEDYGPSDSPPPYDVEMGGSGRRGPQWRDVEYDQPRSRFDGCTQNGFNGYPQAVPSSSRMQASDFRPFAVPQVAHGDGKPFLRGYSDELMQYGISETDFIAVLDKLNRAIIPNPENQIFQMAAQTAGYFVPGTESVALMASRIGAGVASGLGHATMLGKTLSEANLRLFIPRGLEVCLGKVQNVDQEAEFSPSKRGFQGNVDPQSRLEQYGDTLMPLSVVYPEQQKIGRQDPIAMIGKGMSSRDNDRQMKRAGRERQRGRRTKKGDSLEGDLQWLIVRRAAPDSTAKWQQNLQRSEAALAQEQAQGNGRSRR